jgi:hypothetical protein
MRYATIYIPTNETLYVADSYDVTASIIADACSEARPGTPEADDRNYTVINAEDAEDADDVPCCPRCGHPVDGSSGHGGCDHPCHR